MEMKLEGGSDRRRSFAGWYGMRSMLRMTFAGSIVVCASSLFPQPAPNVSEQVAAHLQKAQQYLGENRPDLAIPEYQAVVALNPDDVQTRGNLGVLLYFQSKPAEAIPHLRFAVGKQPSLYKIQGLLGIAELRTQDFPDATRDLESAFPQIPDRKFKTEVGLELVGYYVREGDLDASARIVGQLRKSDPDNPEVLYAAYRTYSDLAGESMLTLAMSSPNSAQMQQVIAHEEAKQGNINGAIDHYRKAIALNPHLPGVHFELAELLNQSPDQRVKQEAETEYRRALAENDQDEKAELRLGAIEAHRGEAQRAFEHYSRAAALQPSDAEAKLGLANTLIEMKQTEKATTLLEEAIKLEPTNAVVHYRLATLYRKDGRMDDAKREVELYKEYKDVKEKLSVVYQELMIHRQESPLDNLADK
jgi:tetratricopeptide (TPR) repeat protein